MNTPNLIKQEIERRAKVRAERKRLWKKNIIRGQALAKEKNQNADNSEQ